MASLVRGLTVAYRGGHETCPRRSAQFVNLSTGEGWALSCRSNGCPYCIEANIWKAGLVLEHSAPTRYAVLTGLSGEWAIDRVKIKALHRYLDRNGYDVRSVYTVEVNPRGTGFHLNLWWHAGDAAGRLSRSGYVSQAVLSEAAVRLGWGRVSDVRAWNTVRATYGLKEASGGTYGLKEASGGRKGEGDRSWVLTEMQAAFLARNGGALLNARPSFWRDGPGGLPLGGRRATLQAVMQLRNGSRERPAGESWAVYAGSEVFAYSAVSTPA